MKTPRMLVWVGIVMLALATTLWTGCETPQTSPSVPPAPQASTNLAHTNYITLAMHGVVMKVDDELGVIIFQGNPGLGRPGLIITCKEQLPEGAQAELFMGNLFILDGDRPGVGQNCLHISITRQDTNTSAQKTVPVPFRSRMLDETVFRGTGKVIASDKKLGLVAVQNGGVDRMDLPALFIDALPKLEKNDPVTCTLKQVKLTAKGLPGAPTYYAFRITVEKSPGKLTGDVLAVNSTPR
ncbi:hypothetical protein EPO17_03035 [Patescibacteria group bacterium]|nr:MAG: hypothetical protein EPO17_03035 [Patescibacteria group bacterium]